jgi:hypothetical protein
MNFLDIFQIVFLTLVIVAGLYGIIKAVFFDKD